MPRLNENQHLRAVGKLQSVMAQNDIARQFGVPRNIIRSLWKRFLQFGNTLDRTRSGRPRVHLRNRFQRATLTARSIPGLWRKCKNCT